jgi:3-hydroxymyristoyl/3-hydroxydecanoyl-(acyl carrier protein) dehydratase
MIAEREEILHLIPQKAPMVMVDGLIDHNESSTTSRLTLSSQNIFCKNGFFREPGLIENIAQTAALRAGYEAQMKGKKPFVGFIGAVKKIKIHILPEDASVIQTTITVLTEVANASLIEGKVYSGAQLMAEGEMTIFKQEFST